MSASAKPPVRLTPADRFRDQIAKAEAEGLVRDELTLKLTYGDANLLRRDQSLALADISFAGGVMRFLGVKIEVGGVEASELLRPE